jgi:hypothetical protein
MARELEITYALTLNVRADGTIVGRAGWASWIMDLGDRYFCRDMVGRARKLIIITNWLR